MRSAAHRRSQACRQRSAGERVGVPGDTRATSARGNEGGCVACCLLDVAAQRRRHVLARPAERAHLPVQQQCAVERLCDVAIAQPSPSSKLRPANSRLGRSLERGVPKRRRHSPKPEAANPKLSRGTPAILAVLASTAADWQRQQHSTPSPNETQGCTTY